MNCPKCNTLNDDKNVFCINCGTTISLNAATNFPLPTQQYQGLPKQSYDTSPSVETAFLPQPKFNQPIPHLGEQTVKKSSKKFVWIGLIVALFLLAGVVAGAIYFIKKQAETAEVLPDHLGMFMQSGDKKTVSEISKQDYANALLAKDDLMKTDALLVAENKPNLILYADGKDIPLNDLKLVQLDTINDDGTLKQVNYQVLFVEGKPEMKRLRVPDGLANGKYAFALFDGFLDEGKHKFWAFEVKNAEKNDNGDLAKVITVSPKPKPSPTPSPKPPPNPPPQNNSNMKDTDFIESPPPPPKVTPPSSGGYAFCRTNNVVLRSAPSLTAAKVDGLYRGQRLSVINQSDNYTTWRGVTGNWVYVETDEGQRGWVFSPLIRY